MGDLNLLETSREATARLTELNRVLSQPSLSRDTPLRVKADLDRLIEENPKSSAGLLARYLRARSYEDGILGQCDIAAALVDYEYLAGHAGELQSEGMVSCARLYCSKNEKINAARALALCEEAVRLDANIRAMMFAGYIHENIFIDFDAAEKMYLKAFRNKSPWGLRLFATAEFKKGNIVRSILAHVIATAISPFLVIFYGKSGPYKL